MTRHAISPLSSHKYYLNRELSLIEFNRRVLLEGRDHSHPLLERLKYVCILSSNLDEFFMIRIAGLKGQVNAGVTELSYDGKTAKEQLREIREHLLPLYELQQIILMDEILPALEKKKIIINRFEDLDEEERSYFEKYFIKKILPVLTPLSIDSAHPFPRFISRSLNIAYSLRDASKPGVKRKLAFLQIPSVLTRFIPIPGREGYQYILVEQLIRQYSAFLFPGLEILSANSFRVTRDADIEIADDEAEDLLAEMQEQVRQRKWGRAAVRLEVNEKMPPQVVKLLMEELELEQSDLYVVKRPLNVGDFFFLASLDLPELKDKNFTTRVLPELRGDNSDIFGEIRKKDLSVHLPFDSFTFSTLRFLNNAADDPNVLAIKITLYRTGGRSDIVDALKRAAESGKDITAFVELKARFDEENNITWARELEQAGVNVVYGVIGLKTHCKVTMVVRNENDKLRTYLHLSTGNYNQSTARVYTDVSVFTARESFGIDSMHLFNYLTGYSYYKDWSDLVPAPDFLMQRTLELIERETQLHTPENPGLIFVKINALAQRDISQALYRASQKGVEIKLLVRGVCCIKPGIKGVSENIRVRSIIGRFLEHSRIFYFRNAGNEEVYISSADWMTRNLSKRVELLVPVYDEKIKKRFTDILDTYWADNMKSWELQPDGSYEKRHPAEGEKPFNAQSYFLEESSSG